MATVNIGLKLALKKYLSNGDLIPGEPHAWASDEQLSDTDEPLILGIAEKLGLACPSAKREVLWVAACSAIVRVRERTRRS